MFRQTFYTTLIIFLAGIATPSAAVAQGRAHDEGLNVVPVPTGEATGVTLDLGIETLESAQSARPTGQVQPGGTLRARSFVRVCWTASRAGFVTLWAQDGDGDVSRVYPNRLTRGGVAKIAFATPAGERECVGDDPRFRLQVSTVPGSSKIWLHWTELEALNLDADAFLNSRQFVHGIQENALPIQHRTQEFLFRVVE